MPASYFALASSFSFKNNLPDIILYYFYSSVKCFGTQRAQFPVIKSTRDHFVQNESKTPGHFLKSCQESKNNFHVWMIDFFDEIAGHRRRPVAPLLIVCTHVLPFRNYRIYFATLRCFITSDPYAWRSWRLISVGRLFLGWENGLLTSYFKSSIIELAGVHDDLSIEKTFQGQRF